MQTHIKVIGWLYIALGVMTLLGAACGAALVVGGGLISGDQTAITVTSIVAVVMVIVLLAVSVPGIIAGAGLLRWKPWARIMALVLAVLNLVSFPFGTILGLYALYALLDDDAQGLFEPSA